MLLSVHVIAQIKERGQELFGSVSESIGIDLNSFISGSSMCRCDGFSCSFAQCTGTGARNGASSGRAASAGHPRGAKVVGGHAAWSYADISGEDEEMIGSA